MIDICILAGGMGSRIGKLWERAKCLAPVAGKPLLERLVMSCELLKPERVTLVLGHRSYEIMQWCANRQEYHVPWTYPIQFVIEQELKGTASALHRAIKFLDENCFLLLNGDTLPLYPLQSLVDYWIQKGAAGTITAAWKDGYYAGASIWTFRAVEELHKHADINDLNYFMGLSDRYEVPGYIDIGTPEAFQLYSGMTEEEFAK